MNQEYLGRIEITRYPLWDRVMSKGRFPLSFELELTARCNNNCRHCYINIPASDQDAIKQELTVDEISRIADEATHMGSFWCTITGGEPLLRRDFPDVYLALRRKGLLVSLMTNACLVNDDHVRLFQRYPPRDIEVTVYGVTPEVYERISRVPGSYDMFRRGLDRLMAAGIKVRLKAMALRSNIHELPAIAEFCRLRTKDYFRFDPQLHLRFDRDPSRNKEILAERLLPREVAAIEQMDQERSDELERNCDRFIWSTEVHRDCNHLFHCATGRYEFTISSEGRLRLCSSLWAPGTTYDLRQGSLKKAWEDFVPGVLSMESGNPTYRERCRVCKIVNLCLWCPAHAYLETGKMDEWVEYFCQVAHARAEAIKTRKNKTISDKEAPTAAAR